MTGVAGVEEETAEEVAGEEGAKGKSLALDVKKKGKLYTRLSAHLSMNIPSHHT